MSPPAKGALHCVVVGAGIVGVATGIWLARAGMQVTVVDRTLPGEGTSHGNAGVLAACSMVPVTSPGLLRKAPGLLMDKDFPLFMRWSYLPRLAPWLWRYMSYANDRDTQKLSEQLAFITADSVEQHQDLAGNTQADQWLKPSDYQFAYRTMADFEADSYVWATRGRHGFVPELITGDAVREREPALGPDIDVLAVLKQHGHVTNPGAYVKSLANVLESSGGSIKKACVRDFTMVNGRVSAVLTDDGEIACDKVVIATGVWSKPLCEKFNLKVPLESERGYHVIFKNPSVSVRLPTMIASGKFVATPMCDGLRCAGIVEFGGLNAGPSREPVELLMRQVKQCLPDLRYSDTVEWLGHRPAPADSLPFIGEIGGTNVFTAFGHHHIGLTGGAKTGRLLAELITNERHRSELFAFRPDRFT